MKRITTKAHNARWLVLVVIMAEMLLSADVSRAVQIEFDYTFDTEGFFDRPMRRQLLETAANHVNRYVDPLEAIVPTQTNGWSTFPPLPPSGGESLLTNLQIPADTIRIIVGGNDSLPEGNLSATNVPPASFSHGTPQWETLLRSRGQDGALRTSPTDFANWGGVMTFNPTANWHFGLTTEELDEDETDFLSVAMHELIHVLGFGPAGSFQALIDFDNRTFTGPAAQRTASENNAPVPLGDGGHWAFGTLSHVGQQGQEALMVPAGPPGERRFPTTLDRAALRDIGWQEAQPGDANLDRQFDADDIVTVLQAGKYATSELASWADGDWNDDLQFDRHDIVSALVTGNYLTGPYSAHMNGHLTPSIWEGGIKYSTDVTITTVPEPASELTAVIASLLLVSVGCRRWRPR